MFEKRSQDLELLNAFVGEWKAHGQNASAAPTAPGGEIDSDEIYEWLPGEKYMTYRFRRRMKDTEHCGTAVIGRDDFTGKVVASFNDNLGFTRRYEVKLEKDNLKFEGEHERAEIKLERGHMRIHWDTQKDGKEWAPLCDLDATRMH